MIIEIIIFLAGVLTGLYCAWLLGGKGIENLQDYFYYDEEGKKYLN